ncbi:MAG: FixH family protein [Limisphaerales bacterium]
MTEPRRTTLNPWPIAIVAYFVVFIGFLAAFIVFAARQSMDLVRADYYDEEIRFQDQLDRLNRTQPVDHQVTVAYKPGQPAVTVELPAAHVRRQVSGLIHFYRPSNARLDQNFRLAVGADGVQKLDVTKLRAGLWKVRVQWTVDGQEYCCDRPIVIGRYSF